MRRYIHGNEEKSMIDLPCPKCAAPACEIEITVLAAGAYRLGRACCAGCGFSTRMIREATTHDEVIRDRIAECWRGEYTKEVLPGAADALELSWRLIAHYGANQTTKGLPHPQAEAMAQIEAQLAILGRPVDKEDSHAA
jgi:hypothetical protein